jgi:hypothetical protein
MLFLLAANLSLVGVEVIDRLGASRGAVKYSDDDGGQYMALLEAVHQLHCLVRCPTGWFNGHGKH